MATNAAKTSSDLDALFTQLAEPFDPSEIKWRVTHTTQDGSRGAVIAFADPRAYTDRLNQLFTPSGWTRNYDVTTVSAVSRLKRDKTHPDRQSVGYVHADDRASWLTQEAESSGQMSRMR